MRPWFAGRILPINENIAERWGKLNAVKRRNGRQITMTDGLIAATALERPILDLDHLTVGTGGDGHVPVHVRQEIQGLLHQDGASLASKQGASVRISAICGNIAMMKPKVCLAL